MNNQGVANERVGKQLVINPLAAQGDAGATATLCFSAADIKAFWQVPLQAGHSGRTTRKKILSGAPIRTTGAKIFSIISTGDRAGQATAEKALNHVRA